MQRTIIIWSWLCLSFLSLCGDLSMQAQTRVSKVTAEKDNDYGVTYTLPQSEIVVDVLVEHTSYQPGPLAIYASSLLGSEAKAQPLQQYHIKDIKISSKGVPDPNHSYKVEFRSGTLAPYVILNDRGLICAINAGSSEIHNWPLRESEPFDLNSLNHQERQNPIQPSLPQEFAIAGSQSRQAEIAARYLYEIREAKIDLMKGNVESMPKDGASLKLAIDALSEQEEASMQLFYGQEKKEYKHFRARIQPGDAISNRVLFRYSEEWGLTTSDDLSGRPVRLDLEIVENSSFARAEEEIKHDRKLKGVVYNVPGLAIVRLSLDGKEIAKTRLPIVQFGHREALAPRMFKPRKGGSIQIYFDPETGSIRRIEGNES